ncbi:MAG TPA: phospho-N-acetylmuramoyl-pentapeptide-transferase [Actinomycetota bacterium]|nr:phospho-N-acetylmuramoyl-pentapeptide-transferase [Actinomycetota bacterium]
MRSVLYAAMVSLFVSLGGTPFLIRIFRLRRFGQLLREDWSDEGNYHEQKRGTPTAGGIIIIVAIVAGYLAAHVPRAVPIKATGLAVLGTIIAMGAVGFTDDYIKIRHQRSLGLNKTAKVLAQLAVAIGLAVVVIHFTGQSRFVTHLSFVRRTRLDLGEYLFIAWVFVVLSATTNGVNLTDGLDGLAAGASAIVFTAYVFIAFWQFRHPIYEIHDALELAIVAAAGLGACAGFLWWNAAPARIFMGDTGSLALGGGIAALAIFTSTHLLLVVIGGLFVLETTSVIMQVVAFRGFKRRVFKMAPVHHHFELGGWPEFTVIVRFWIIAGLSAALGIGLFYADFLARGGLR